MDKTNRIIYLDNGATTQICPEAIQAMQEGVQEFGNPSSVHLLGGRAKNALNKSRRRMEQLLGAEEGTFYFTSGATEANNWAIFGTTLRNEKNGRHIITAQTEHSATLEPIRCLENKGFEVDYIGVDGQGRLDTEELYSRLRPDTVLVSVMSVNNETGVCNDVETIGNQIKKQNPRTLFHVDGVASFCKVPVRLNAAKIDLFSLSGHKFHAPKGIGGLYIRKGVNLSPLIFGGGQQKNLRSGTESTLLISAMTAAAKVCCGRHKENYAQALRLKNQLVSGLSRYDFAKINGASTKEEASPYVLNVGFAGCRSQILLNALEEYGVYVSSGSACSANKGGKNHVLQAMGVDEDYLEGALRFSFSGFNTQEDVNLCLEALEAVLKRYRGLNR